MRRASGTGCAPAIASVTNTVASLKLQVTAGRHRASQWTMKPHILIFCVVAALARCAAGQDSADVQARMKALEDRIQALEMEVQALKGQTPAAPTAAAPAAQAPQTTAALGGAGGAAAKAL